jgi:hypothetical protein
MCVCVYVYIYRCIKYLNSNKVISEHISDLNTQTNRTVCSQCTLIYSNLNISAISGQMFQKDIHSWAVTEDAVISYWIII